MSGAIRALLRIIGHRPRIIRQIIPKIMGTTWHASEKPIPAGRLAVMTVSSQRRQIVAGRAPNMEASTSGCSSVGEHRDSTAIGRDCGATYKRGINQARVVCNRTDGPLLIAVGLACWVHDLPTSTAPPESARMNSTLTRWRGNARRRAF